MNRMTSRRVLAASIALATAVLVAPQFAGAGADPGAGDPGESGAPESPVSPRYEPQGPFCSSIPADGEGSFAGMADDPVGLAAANNPYLTTLASALGSAGLVDTLNGPGPFTVFAPSNEAISRIPSSDLEALLADTDRLSDLLLYHVIAGESLTLSDLAQRGSVRSVQGQSLVFTMTSEGWLSINDGAAVTVCADIETANATVHVIDNVLIPPTETLMETR